MITIGVLADSKYPVDREGIRKHLTSVLEKHRLTERVAVDVLVVGKRKMSQLHEQFMNIPGPTDVLSFPQNDASTPFAFVASPDGILRLGDIVICYPVAMEEALKKQVKVDTQVQFLAEHGIMHLMGFHHE